MVIRGVPALGQAVGQGLLVDINGQTKKYEHGGFSLAAEQWRGGRGIAGGERVVEQEATTTAGKNAGPTAPMSPILRRRRTGGKRSTEEWAPVFWVWVLHALCRLPGPASDYLPVRPDGSLLRVSRSWRNELETSTGYCIQCSALYTISSRGFELDRKSTRLNSSHMSISYAVFCLKKKNKVKST